MIELLDDPSRFAARAEPLLHSTVENTVLATVLDGILHGVHADRTPRFALITGRGDEVIGAALRTPPFPLLCTALSDEDAPVLMTRWLTRDPELPGVNGLAATARALAGAYRQVTGCRSELRTSMALHALEQSGLREPRRPAAGELRASAPAERELMLDWGRAFAVEADTFQHAEAAARSAGQLVDDGRLYVWDCGGAPVSLVGHTPMIAGAPRVGPVYTPPAHRGRGYASAAVCAVSRRLFATGAVRVVLFTDLANPISNRIYAALGYRQIGDFEHHGFLG